MSKLEKAIYELGKMEQVSEQASPLHAIDARAKLLVTVLFLICVLSLPPANLSRLILYLAFPIISCSMAGIGYGSIFCRSLIVLPFILLIGIFNPIFDKQVVFYINGVGITSGWLSFISILIRGLVSVQAVFILIYSTGFYRLCKGMQHLGIPALLATQLLFVYRYIFVLLQEALNMDRARMSRSFGRKSYSLKMWGIFIGQLLLRTIDRSERIHYAMLSRGFNGSMPSLSDSIWRRRETIYMLAWSVVFLLIRFYPARNIFNLFTFS